MLGKIIMAKKKYTPNFWKICLSLKALFLGAAFGVVLIYLLGKFVFGNTFVDVIDNAHGIMVSSGTTLTVNEKQALSHLIGKGYILPSEVLIDTMVNFYNSIINWLIALIALAGIIAYSYIKGISALQAEELIKEKTNEQFKKLQDSRKFSADIVAQLLKSDGIRSFLDDMSQLDKKDEISQIKEQLKQVIKQVSKLDKDEQTVDNTTITVGDE